jgi:hypothetical protein
MKSVPLFITGVAYIPVAIASLRVGEDELNAEERLRRGVDMPKFYFLWDTGATQTTIPKQTLIDELGYTEKYIAENKILIPDDEKPVLADGTKADVYKLPATRMNIGGHELIPKPNYIFTSDTINNLSLLLGTNIMRYFKFTFDFDALDSAAPYGRMFYEFRSNCTEPYTEIDEPFAYRLGATQTAESSPKGKGYVC